MKKFLLSLVVLGMTSTVAIGATTAYFSDTEISSANTFTAGTLDLKVNGKDSEITHIARTGIKPGPHYTEQLGGGWNITNSGTVPGTVTVTLKNVKNYENGCLEPEISSGDVTCGVEDNQGDLGSGLLTNIVWSLNQAPWGSVSPTFTSINAAQNVPVTGDKFHLEPGETKAIYLNINWDTSGNDNLGQGDSIEFDVEFTLNQD